MYVVGNEVNITRPVMFTIIVSKYQANFQHGKLLDYAYMEVNGLLNFLIRNLSPD